MFANYQNSMRNANEDDGLAHLRMNCEVLDVDGNPKVIKPLQLPILSFTIPHNTVDVDQLNNNICNYDSLVEELLSDSDSEDEDGNEVLYHANNENGDQYEDADTAIDSDDLDAMSDGIVGNIPDEG